MELLDYNQQMSAFILNSNTRKQKHNPMERQFKLFTKLAMAFIAGMIFLSSCALQPDEEVLDDIADEFSEKTTNENNTKKKK